MSKSPTKKVLKTKNSHARGSIAKTTNGNGRGTAVQIIRPLTASALKDALWETLTDLRSEQILPSRADAIAAQSREILRTISTQLRVAAQGKRALPEEIIEFSERR